MPKLPKRRQIRLKGYNYSLPGYYYITICTQDREQLFGDVVNGKMKINNIGKMVNKFWLKLPKRFDNIKLDQYQIMPNHIHFIIRIVGAIHESPDMIHKSSDIGIHANTRAHRDANTRAHRDANTRAHRDTPLRWGKRQLLPKCIGYLKMNSSKQINQLKNISGQSVWQRNYYEHIIRNETELNKIREYITLNPAMWDRDRNNTEKFKGN